MADLGFVNSILSSLLSLSNFLKKASYSSNEILSSPFSSLTLTYLIICVYLSSLTMPTSSFLVIACSSFFFLKVES